MNATLMYSVKIHQHLLDAALLIQYLNKKASGLLANTQP